MKGVIYARYSTPKQDKKSIKDQALICEAEAQRKGIEITATFFDIEESGYNPERPGYTAMLEYIRNNRVKYLLVHHTSRISRDTAELKIRARELKYLYGVEILFVSQGISTENENFELLFSAYGIADEQYIESVRKNTWRGLYGRLLTGKAVMAPRYGYKLENGELKIDEAQAKVVRKIYELYSRGHGYKYITQLLNKEGIPAPRGSRWTHNAVREILINEIYKGVLVWNKAQYKKIPGFSRRKKIPNPPEQWIKIERPDLKIVEPELWEECQRIRESKKKVQKQGKGVAHTTLLGGFIKCAKCGSNFIKATRVSFKCSGVINGYCDAHVLISEKMLNKLTINAIRSFLEENRHRFKQELEESIKRHFSTQVSRAEIEKEIELLENKLAKALKVFEEIPSRSIAKQIKEYEERLEELRLQLGAISEVNEVEIDDSVIDLLIEEIDGVLTMDIQEGRRIISMVLKEITVEEDKDIAGSFWVEFRFRNPLCVFDRKIGMVAGADFNPVSSITVTKRFLLAGG
jgi:DNA invertase Pin-like site-specific DNA recombinase